MNIEDLKNEIMKTLEGVDIEILKKINIERIVDNVSREMKLLRLEQNKKSMRQHRL